MVGGVIRYFSKKLSDFKNGLRTTRRKLEISLAFSLCVLLFSLFRILIYHAGFGAKLGQQIYLTAPKNVSVERTIDIIMSSDDEYVHNSAATIASTLLNCDATSNFRFHILDGGISESKKEKLVKIKKLRDFEIKFYDMTKYDWSVFPDNRKHTALATYYRLRIPEILPENIQKALYLDGDMIIEQDLKELWDVDMSDYMLGAVEDEEGIESGMRLGLTKKYFNAGLLLLNLNKLRKINLIRDGISYLGKNRERIIYQDQDILNGLFNTQYKNLPLKWNVNSSMYSPTDTKHTYTDYDMKIARKNPGIIHFSGDKFKPWYWGWVPHPLAEEYWKYLKYTEFFSSTHREFIFRKRIKRYAERIKSYFKREKHA